MAARGRKCEQYVREFFPAWESRGWLAFKNHKSEHNREGEPFDFTIIKEGQCVFLECKETGRGLFRLGSDKRFLKQANNLERVRRLGHLGFFVVLFTLQGRVGIYEPLSVFDGVRIEDSLGKLDGLILGSNSGYELDCN